MKYTITELNLDFEDDGFECPVLEQERLYREAADREWEADDLESLKAAVSVYTGFTVSHIAAECSD